MPSKVAAPLPPLARYSFVGLDAEAQTSIGGWGMLALHLPACWNSVGFRCRVPRLIDSNMTHKCALRMSPQRARHAEGGGGAQRGASERASRYVMPCRGGRGAHRGASERVSRARVAGPRTRARRSNSQKALGAASTKPPASVSWCGPASTPL